jgi:hypothetical protein
MPHTDTRIYRGFIRFSQDRSFQQELADDLANEESVLLSFHRPSDGAAMGGELRLNWRPLPNGLTPVLEVYDSSWEALRYFTDVFEMMARVYGQRIDPEAFCAALVELGLSDLTDSSA